MAAKRVARSRSGAKKPRVMSGKKMTQTKLTTRASAPIVKGISTRAVQTQAKSDWHGKPDTGPKVPK